MSGRKLPRSTACTVELTVGNEESVRSGWIDVVAIRLGAAPRHCRTNVAAGPLLRRFILLSETPTEKGTF